MAHPMALCIMKIAKSFSKRSNKPTKLFQVKRWKTVFVDNAGISVASATVLTGIETIGHTIWGNFRRKIYWRLQRTKIISVTFGNSEWGFFMQRTKFSFIIINKALFCHLCTNNPSLELSFRCNYAVSPWNLTNN